MLMDINCNANSILIYVNKANISHTRNFKSKNFPAVCTTRNSSRDCITGECGMRLYVYKYLSEEATYSV